MNKLNILKSNLIVFMTLMVFPTFAQSGLKTDKVVIFTDANSYVQKSGTIEAKYGLFELSGEELPAARFGTLEITDIENTILNITSSIKPKISETTSYNITNTQELLNKNKGIKLKIITEDTVVSGELFAVFQEYIVVKSDKMTMVRIADIQLFSFESEPIFIKAPEQKDRKSSWVCQGMIITKM